MKTKSRRIQKVKMILKLLMVTAVIDLVDLRNEAAGRDDNLEIQGCGFEIAPGTSETAMIDCQRVATEMQKF